MKNKRPKQAKPGKLKFTARQSSKPKLEKNNSVPETAIYEAEVLEGMVPFCIQELRRNKDVKLLAQTKESIRFTFAAQAAALKHLKKAVAVYECLQFDVPRPKALLGDQHFRRLVTRIETLRSQSKEAFTSFRFAAAGSDSPVFTRFAQALSKALKLPYKAEEGDLLIRVKPAQKGWDVLIRLTPRPLSARSWRMCNMPGGLNATIAVAMNDLARAKPIDTYLNAMCGSGTLLIEQALARPVARLVGIDRNPEAIACTQENINTANLKQDIILLKADATDLSYEANSFSVITADLPWGDAVGTHKTNAVLYPAFLKEMHRIATKNARLVILTHEIKLFERVLNDSKDWRIKKSVRVAHSGHHPGIYLLQSQSKR